MRRFSRGLLVALAACGLAAVGCRNRNTAPSRHKGQTILLTDSLLDAGGCDTVRFGHLHSGEIAAVRLWLQNDTQKPLVITAYDRSCGCTALEYDRAPIAPGQSSRLDLTFDSRGEYGWQLRTLGIRFGGVSRPLRLVVEADVE